MAAFVLNDETKKNSHGFYLLNAGGHFERFADNPVMLYNHDIEKLIGRWVKLRAEGSRLIADPEFDEVDPDSAKIKGKVDREYLRGASCGIIILSAEWRESPATGESELFVTEWELFEGSIVSIPSNAGALSLKIYDSNSRLVRDENIKLHIENIVKLGIDNKHKQVEEMAFEPTAEALVALGITDKTDSITFCAKVVALKAKLDAKTVELDGYKQTARSEQETRVKETVNLAIKQGKITADKKDAFVKLGISDFETVKTTLEGIPEKQNLSARITSVLGKTAIPEGRATWTLSMWMQKDMPGLNKLKAEEPEVFEEIKKRN